MIYVEVAMFFVCLGKVHAQNWMVGHFYRKHVYLVVRPLVSAYGFPLDQIKLID